MGKVREWMTEEDKQEFYLEVAYTEWEQAYKRESKLKKLAKEILELYVMKNIY